MVDRRGKISRRLIHNRHRPGNDNDHGLFSWEDVAISNLSDGIYPDYRHRRLLKMCFLNLT